MNVVNIWRTTLERLETAPIDAVCKAWLLSANLTNASYNGMDDFDVDALTDDESLYFTSACHDCCYKYARRLWFF